jgi:hypothetical protein
MQLHLFAFWFVNYHLVKYKIMIIILKIMLNINQSISLCGLSISPSWIKSLLNFHFIISYQDFSKPDSTASYI